MKVRKKKSKRMTTRLKMGIKKKVAAYNRKKKKLDKKDITWKSRSKKDPGIPNSFPYKEEFFEEIKLQRDQQINEKKKINNLEIQFGQDCDIEDVENHSEQANDDNKNDLGALLVSAQKADLLFQKKNINTNYSDDEMLSDDDVEYPISDFENENNYLNPQNSTKAFQKIFHKVLNISDLILCVLDARDPESTRFKTVEEQITKTEGKKLFFILNKADLVPEPVLIQWINLLKKSFPTFPFKAVTAHSDLNLSSNKYNLSQTSDLLLNGLKSYTNKLNLKRSLIVGVIGYPNVGKSSIINALTVKRKHKSKKVPTGNVPGVTTVLREIKIDSKLKVLDSPGLIFYDNLSNQKKSLENDRKINLLLLSSLPHKYMTDVIRVFEKLLEKISSDEKLLSHFKNFYNLSFLTFSELNDHSKEILIHVARSRGKLGKGGVPNLESAALSILNDWWSGKIVAWSTTSDFNTDSKIETSNSDSNKNNTYSIVPEWSKCFDLLNL